MKSLGLVWIPVLLVWTIALWLLADSCSPIDNDPRYIGCYNDDEIREKWKNVTKDITEPMGVDVCAAKCIKNGSHLSGLTNGNQCWCSNGTVGRLFSEGYCNFPCIDNNAICCGGEIGFDVYDVVIDNRYLGCYEDAKGVQPPFNALEKFLGDFDNLTVDICIAECGKLSYMFSGTVFTRKCFCGNNDYALNGKCIRDERCDCDNPCLQNQTEKCGGVQAISVYTAECRTPGYYGGDCEKICHCKNGAACNISTGQCPNEECAPGWEGLSCNEMCSNGYYGENCDNSCDQCLERACNRFDGLCNDSCAAGLEGFPVCNEPCSDGYYGENCNKTCNQCSETACERVNGLCNVSCATGLQTFPSCNESCATGTFGDDCLLQCRCNSSLDCDKISGKCSDNLCSPGFNGPDEDPACQRECDEGSFGLNCALECHCFNSSLCNKTSGFCPDDLCAPGYDNTDKTCQTSCSTGTFGFHCSKKCQCFDGEDCDKQNGICPNGICQPGFDFKIDPSCQIECHDGTFGLNCMQECHCFNSSTCHKISGFCPYGLCAPGFNNSDSQCQTECLPGTYGLNCMEKCPCDTGVNCICEEESSALTIGLAASACGTILLVAVLGMGFILKRKRNAEGKTQGSLQDLCCEEEPYHPYEYINDDVKNDATVKNTRKGNLEGKNHDTPAQCHEEEPYHPYEYVIDDVQNNSAAENMRERNTGKKQCTPGDKHHEEGPYHPYDYIIEDVRNEPAVKNTRNNNDAYEEVENLRQYDHNYLEVIL